MKTLKRLWQWFVDSFRLDPPTYEGYTIRQYKDTDGNKVKSITCGKCGMTSFSRYHIDHKLCDFCHTWLDL
jgi:ribosomal protein S27AE